MRLTAMTDKDSRKLAVRNARTHAEMLADFRDHSPEQLVAEIDKLLGAPVHFAPGPRSSALLTIMRERLIAQKFSHDQTDVANVNVRGEVAYQLHLRNPHLEVSTARTYVDAVCEEFAKLRPKETP